MPDGTFMFLVKGIKYEIVVTGTPSEPHRSPTRRCPFVLGGQQPKNQMVRENVQPMFNGSAIAVDKLAAAHPATTHSVLINE